MTTHWLAAMRASNDDLSCDLQSARHTPSSAFLNSRLHRRCSWAPARQRRADAPSLPSGDRPSVRVRIGPCGVGSDALGSKYVEGRRAGRRAGADGLRALLEHDIISQRRRVEVDKLALRPAGIDDIAVGVGSRITKKLSDPVHKPGNPGARAE